MHHERSSLQTVTPAAVDTYERIASVLGGLLLVVYGIVRIPLTAVALILSGLYLLYRGVTGRCYICEMLGLRRSIRPLKRPQNQNPFRNDPPPSVEQSDKVTEASWESFPTSDAPSWTMGVPEEGR